ncbi:25227_t:CDS:2 [Dentiscutata erythropus]|uniref:25227_t:CDS:1 n=1 Tax=Dentiscutata erythropus TaxID=1348616 RepID=A0A9N9B688_9GLOM|nr:25227_t:CDS:2 [Dentiscutata erythropus]
MPKYPKKQRQIIQLTANREKAKKITSVENTFQCLDKNTNNLPEEKLIELIQDLSDDEKEDAIKLLENMRYPRGKNEGKIISQYLQWQLDIKNGIIDI